MFKRTMRFVKEPLLQFVLLGAMLFGVGHLFDATDMPRESEIVVSEGTIKHLAMIFSRTWQRPPTHQELNSLVHEFLREEVAYREGMAMGLDYDDTIIRRRIRQKLDFIADDLAGSSEPTAKELEEFFSAHAEDYRVDPRLSFHQIYFSAVSSKSGASRDAQLVLAALKRDPASAIDDLGDRNLLEPYYENLSAREINAVFGSEFADAILDLEPGPWQGPLRSGYGLHLVRIEERVEGYAPKLHDIWEAVARDWESAHRQEAIDQFYQGLLEKYDIRIDWPQAVDEAESP